MEAPNVAAPSTPTPEAHGQSSGRAVENVAADALTPAEIDALFAAQTSRSQNPMVGSTAVMDESDMNTLLRSLGEDPGAQSAWLPGWAYDAAAAYDDDAADDDASARANNARANNASETLQIVRDLDNTVATIDDTTVATRDGVLDLAEAVKTLQAQVEGIGDNQSIVKVQNAVIAEEVRELRAALIEMHKSLATLVELRNSHMAPAGVNLEPAASPADT